VGRASEPVTRRSLPLGKLHVGGHYGEQNGAKSTLRAALTRIVMQHFSES
jgi:hypothetical protein